MHALAARVRSLRPGLRVTVGFLEFDRPSVPGALAGLHAAGVREAVAVPLLLTRAYHAKTDIPAVLAECLPRLPGLRVRRAGVLGQDPLLLGALERRLAQAVRPGAAGERARVPLGGPAAAARTGIVLAAAGSSDPAARTAVGAVARSWRERAGWAAVRPAFASAAQPGTADAVRALRADGIGRVLVAPLVIAPGRLPGRIAAAAREAGADALAPVLGAAPELAALLLRRHDEAAAASGAADHTVAGTYL